MELSELSKEGLYSALLDCCVFIRYFMFNENFYHREVDDSLQLLIDDVKSYLSSD